MSESSMDDGLFFSSISILFLGDDGWDSGIRFKEVSRFEERVDEEGLMCIFDFKGIKAGKNAQNNDCEQFHLNFLI